MTEEWRIAPGSYGCYEVSNLGRVRRVVDQLLLKVSKPRHSREYPAVMMRYIGLRKRRSVHTLVALAFVGPPPFIGAEVRHLDGDHCNPRSDNLAWGSGKDNAADREAHGRTARGDKHGAKGRDFGGANNPNGKLNDAAVASIIKLSSGGLSQRMIAERTGASQRTVWAILSGKSYVAAALRSRSEKPSMDEILNAYVDVFFQSLAAWREETAHLSFVEDKTRSPHFKKIVSLGNHVVRLIVDELRQEPSFLFLALEEITGEDHVAPSSYGKPIEMVNDWLQWYENVGVNPSTQRFDTAQRLFPPEEQTHQGGSSD